MINSNYFKKSDKTKYELFLLITIILLGSTLRIYKLGYKSLWFDEFFSIRDSQKINTAIRMRGHPPLYFMILHIFRYINESEFVLRLPSAIFGILTIFLIYKIGTDLFGIEEGLFSALLLSVSTLHIYYSQEARMYTQFVFFSLLSLFFFYRAIKKNEKKEWVFFVFSTVLNLYTHYYSFLTIIVEISFFILLSFKKLFFEKSLKKDYIYFIGIFILSMFTIFVLYFPWSFILLRTTQDIVSSPSSGISWIEQQWIQLESGINLLPIIFSKFSVGYGATLIIFLLFFLYGVITDIRKEETLLSLLWISLPIILLLLISTYIRPMISSGSLRFILFILPIYLLLISKGIVNFVNLVVLLYKKLFKSIARARLIKILFSIFIVVLFIIISIKPINEWYNGNYVNMKYKPYYTKQDWKGAINYVKMNLMFNDIIIIEPERFAPYLAYYFDDEFEHFTFARARDIIGTNITERFWVLFSDWWINEGIRNWFLENFGSGKLFDGRINVYLIQPEKEIDSAFNNLDTLIFNHTVISTTQMIISGADRYSFKIPDPGFEIITFWHNNDMLTFNVSLPINTSYTMEIFAVSDMNIVRNGSAVDIIIDGEHKDLVTFKSGEWTWKNLGTYQINEGIHEIRILNREGLGLGDTNIAFTHVRISWSKD